MGCFYTKENIQYSSELELLQDFLANNFQLKEGSIYSAEAVQESTLNKLSKITDSNEFDADADKSIDSKEEETRAKYMTIQDLAVKEHPAIFSQIEEISDLERLSPEYNEDNRVLNYILKHIEESDNYVPSEFKEQLKEESLKGKNTLYSGWRFEKLKGESQLKGVDHDLIKYFQSQIESEIDIEKITAKFANQFYKFSKLVLSGKSIEEDFSDFYNDPINKDIFGNVYSREDWLFSITNIINNIKNKVESIGIPITDLKLVSTAPLVNVKGIISLLAVDLNGNAHIFNIKMSKNNFTNWDSAKLANADWELALQRQLLGQHINIDRTQLYIVPISISGLQNPTKIRLEDFENRTIDTLTPDSKISRISDKLIPRKFFPKHDDVKIEAIKEKFNKLIPNYEIKTEIEDDNIDTIMKNAEKRFNKEGVWKKYNGFEGIEGLKKGWVEETDRGEFERKMLLYVAHVQTMQNRGTSTIREAINSAIATNQSFKTSKYNVERDQVINHLLQQYFNDDWEVMNSIPESISLGIILLRNIKTGVINVFNLSVNQFKFTHKETGLTVGEIEMMKVMLFLNEFRDHLFPNTSFKLGEIITFNPREGSNHYDPSLETFERFKDVMARSGLSGEVKISEKNILGTEDIALLNLKNAFQHYVGKEAENLGKILNIFEDRHLSEIDKEKLIKVRNEFLIKYPEYKKLTIKPELNFNDPLEIIFSLLQVAILSKEGIDPTGDFRDLSKYSLGFSDFKSLISSIYSKDVQQYDKVGKKIQGVVGGLAWTTPEWVQSKDLRQINGLISTGNSIIGERITKFSEKMWAYTEDFYNAIGYNRLNQLVWGETQTIHEEFFIKDDTGKVHRDFKTKNPYISDVTNALSSEHRKYLQKTLLLINGYKLGIADKEIEKLDPFDLNSIRSNEAIAEAIDKGEYFEMPLVRREELSRYKGLFSTAGDSFRRLGAIKDDITDWIDSRELSQYDISNIDAQKMGFFEMYDAYGTQSKEIKDKMIDENTVDYYEFNLDTIAHRLAFSKIRKQTFDMILPTVSAYMWWIKLMGGRQNLDVSKQLEYIVNQVKLAVFDEPLIGDEQATIAKGIAFAKQVSTVAMLAFRPALLAKEMTIGVLKNISAAGTGLNEEFGAKEMTAAYTKLITINKQFTNEFNMIQKMNHLYRIANMDISTVPKKIQHDRHGVARGFGRWMFTTSTAADYYNRMAILLAKMIKDGSYEAHSMKGNVMTYDPKKDKRFEYYLKERDNNKDKDGNYIPKKGDNKYNDQRNLYLLTIQQLNKEYTVVGRKPLKESDLIEKAYTQKERDSIKAFSDLIYGAYDKDSQAQFPNTLAGIAFMQFMTYWPSKMKFWFGKPTSAEDSAIGKYEHAYRKDKDGKPVKNEKGEPIYLYWDYVKNADGVVERVEVEHETDEKILTWNGTPQEGLFYSVAYTLQDIVRGNWDELKNNKLRRNRTMFALGDAVFIFILLGIIKAIFDNLVAENGRDSFSGEALYFMDTVNDKVLNEYDVWNNTLGAINTEPLFLSWGVRVSQNIQSVFEGNESLKRALGQSIGALEFLKE